MKSPRLALILRITLMILMVSCFALYHTVFAEDIVTNSLRLSCSPVYSIFEGNENVTYTINWVNSEITTNKEIHVVVTNYYKDMVFENTIYVSSELESAVVNIPQLNCGSFEISAEMSEVEAKTTFSIAPKLSQRRDSSKSSLALASMATHTVGKRDTIEEYVRTISLAGINYVRDFCLPKMIAMEDGTYTYTRGDNYAKYDEIMQAYKDNNISVLFMFSDMPEFMCRDGHKIPDNLFDTYNFVKQLCEHYNGQMDSLEILNEADLDSDKDGPDQYAAFLKAAAIAALDSQSGVKIANGGYSGWAGFLDGFRRIVLQNEADDYFDIYNNHFYQDYNSSENITKFPDTPRNFIEEIENYGISNKQLWLSEFGLRIPLTDSSNELTFDQQKAQARTAPTAFIKAVAAGFDKSFWFLHGYINEGGKTYGTMSQDKKPYLVYSAISAFTNAMGNAKYKGKFNNMPTGVEGYCFVEDNESVGCFWSETETNMALNARRNKLVLTDIMGNETILQSSNGIYNITVGPDIIYVRIEDAFPANSIDVINNYVKTDNTVMLSDAQRIVILPEFEAAAEVNPRLEAYQLSAEGENTVTLHLYNFNNTPMTGAITAQSTGGWSISSNIQQVTIPAMSKVDLTFTVTATENISYQLETPLIFSGEFNGNKTSDAVSYIKTKEFIESEPIFDGFDIASNWTNLVASDTNVTTQTISDGIIGFTYDFNGVEKWSKPSLELPSNLDFDDSLGFVYDYKADCNVENVRMYVFITENDGETHYAAQSVNLDSYPHISVDISSEWKQSIFYWKDIKYAYGTINNKKIDFNNIEYFRIGFTVNGTATDFTLYIKNLGLFNYGNYGPEIQVTGINYENEVLKTYFSSDNLKSVKHIINRKFYDANITDNSSELNVLLPDGNYDIRTMVCDNSNFAHAYESSLTVTWPENNYIISYDANGGNNAPSCQLKLNGSEMILSSGIPNKDGCVFVGWSLNKNDTVVQYEPGSIFNIDASTVLYAVWDDNIVFIFNNNILFNDVQKTAVIRGNVGSEYSGKLATILIVTGTHDVTDIQPSDVKYINEIVIGADGNYLFRFDISDDVENEYYVVMNIGGKFVSLSLESVEINYKWIDAAISITQNDNQIVVVSSTKNFSNEKIPYTLIIAYYNSEGSLLKMSRTILDSPVLGGESKVVQDIADGATDVRSFIWSANGGMVPLCRPSVGTLSEKTAYK